MKLSYSLLLWIAAVALDRVRAQQTNAYLQYGQTLQSEDGDFLKSGPFRFGLESNGDLFLDGAFERTVFANGGPGCFLTMQGDGNLVIYRSDSTVAYATHTRGNHGARLVLDEDSGFASVIAIDGKILKTFRPRGCVGILLQYGERIGRGEFICYNRFRFGLTLDGDVMYGYSSGVRILYSLNSSMLKMQKDGNLVLSDNQPQCSSGTDGNVAALYLTDMSGPKILDGRGKKIWDLSAGLQCSSPSSSTWLLIGEILEEDYIDEDDLNVSLSSDGNVLAIGAPFYHGDGDDSGRVRVFEYSDGSWTQRGDDIYSEASIDLFGFSVSLSSDGNVVAIGAPSYDGNGRGSGRVRVYGYNNGKWAQRGDDIDGEAVYDGYGESVSLSSDGSVLAIGAPGKDKNDSGHVRVFGYSNGAWTQRGDDIDGEAVNDHRGETVSLSSDGNVLAIGVSPNDGNGSKRGYVRVFVYSNGAWTQLGEDIAIKAGDNWIGGSMSLSSDGNVVAISAFKYGFGVDGNGYGNGHVSVYEYSNGRWMQLGSDIDGKEYEEGFGNNVSLSSDGKVLATGASYNGVRVYDFEENTWKQRGGTVGEVRDIWSLSLSFDGSVVAIGNNGRVRVYKDVEKLDFLSNRIDS